MEQTLFLVLFTLGFIVFYLSTRINDVDISNTYQVQLTFLSLIVWTAVLYSSFNIEIYNETFAVKQIVDYGYIGISLAMFIISLLNMLVLGLVGSWNMIFRTSNQK